MRGSTVSSSAGQGAGPAAEQLQMRWVSVTDEHGRARLESRWECPGARADVVPAAVTHAA